MSERPKLTARMVSCLSALGDLYDKRQPMESNYGPRSCREGWFTADHIGEHAKLPRVNRHGNGAVAGSWSGTIAAGLQAANTMMALERRGLVMRRYGPDRERTVNEYKPTKDGLAEVALLREEAIRAVGR